MTTPEMTPEQFEKALEVREDTYKAFLEWRGINRPCLKCSGRGVFAYGSSSIWRGGVGGQTVTEGVCDLCWGSGDATHAWVDLRKTSAQLAQKDEELSEIKEYHKRIMSEECPKDEWHCTCVPALREGIAQKDKVIEEVSALIQKVLDDSESRPGGWGPDVTCVGYLKIARQCLKEIEKGE